MTISNRELLETPLTAHEARWASELADKLPDDVDLTFEESKILTRLSIREWPDALILKVKDVIDAEDFLIEDPGLMPLGCALKQVTHTKVKEYHRLKYQSKIFLPLLLTLALLALSACTDNKNAEIEAKAKAQKESEQLAAKAAFAATTTATRKAAAFAAQTSAARKSASNIKYNAGESPEYAKKCGWPVNCSAPLPGSILPSKRIVAYYGNPLSKKMGALGEFPKDEMLQRLKGEVAKWQAADPATPVQPALHLIAVVAQGAPGKDSKYRMIMPDKIINQVYGWTKEAGAVMFIDIQTGHDDIRSVLPRFEWILKNPDVHLGIDPEFNLIKSGKKPGKKIGTYDAADINYASAYLKDLVKKYNLPPKVFTVHRFTRNGVTNSKNIVLHPEVQLVMHMDGWGAPWLKRDSYKDYVVSEPVQYTGFKLFYHNDTKKGDPLMTPQDLLKLNPKPLYIQYQ